MFSCMYMLVYVGDCIVLYPQMPLVLGRITMRVCVASDWRHWTRLQPGRRYRGERRRKRRPNCNARAPSFDERSSHCHRFGLSLSYCCPLGRWEICIYCIHLHSFCANKWSLLWIGLYCVWYGLLTFQATTFNIWSWPHPSMWLASLNLHSTRVPNYV